MGLLLGLREGEGFTVGPHSFTIEKIRSETSFRLRSAGGDVFEIDDQTSKLVADGVRVICGLRGQRTLARVSIEADKSMRISRQTR